LSSTSQNQEQEADTFWDSVVDMKVVSIGLLLFVAFLVAQYGGVLQSVEHSATPRPLFKQLFMFGYSSSSDQLKASLNFFQFVILFVPNIIFLSYRQNYYLPSYENHKKSSRQNMVICWVVSIAALALCWFFSIGLWHFMLESILSICLSSPMIFFVVKNYFLHRKTTDAASGYTKKFLSFENRIYIPAVILCFTNLGIGFTNAKLYFGSEKLYYGSELNSFEDLWNILAGNLLWISTPLIIMSLFYFLKSIKRAFFLIELPFLTVAMAIFLVFFFKLYFLRYLVIGFTLTYMLGVAEIPKHIFFMDRLTAHEKNNHQDENESFYHIGANWASVIFPTLSLAIPVIFTSMSFEPIIVLVFFSTLSWLLMEPANKKSMKALFYCLCVGILTPIAYSASALGVGIDTFIAIKADTDSAMKVLSIGMLTLMSLLGFTAGLMRLAKDLFGLNLTIFTKNIFNPSLYKGSVGPLFLLLFSTIIYGIAIVSLWIGVVFYSSIEATDAKITEAMSLRLPVAELFVALLALFAVFSWYIWPRKLKRLLNETAMLSEQDRNDHNSGSNNGQQKPAAIATPPAASLQNSPSDPNSASIASELKMVLASGRLTVSLIAGLATALLIGKAKHWEIESTILVLVAMTFVTMAGFIFNDLFDIEKDKVAGKNRPITTGLLAAPSAFRYAIALVGIACCVSALFGAVALLWIAAIAFALVVYSPISSRIPLVKGIYTAFLCITPFLFSNSVGGIALPLGMITMMFVYFVFRELVLDAIDVEGDTLVGIKTIAYYTGSKTSLVLGWTGMFIAISILGLMFGNSYSRIIVLVGLAFQFYALYRTLNGDKDGIDYTRLTLLSGVAAMYFYA
jgi:4-hydroxybenzoate polyprenyltransferase